LQQLEQQFGKQSAGEGICFLPYNAQLTLNGSVGIGVDMLIAGMEGGFVIEGGAEIGSGDDRNFSGNTFYRLGIYFKAYLFFAGFEYTRFLTGTYSEIYCDDFDHYKSYFYNLLYQKFFQILNSLNGASAQHIEPVEVIESTKAIISPTQKLAPYIGNFSLSLEEQTTSDSFIRVRDGALMNGKTKNTSTVITLEEVYPLKKRKFNITIHLNWDQVDNNYNGDNNGSYFGWKIDFWLSKSKSTKEATSHVVDDLNELKNKLANELKEGSDIVDFMKSLNKINTKKGSFKSFFDSLVDKTKTDVLEN